ncbi:hypothetical protein B5807_11348 [Epicoccum nigrum]|uniref:Zn(2)-C6 fungal-type domain-containing protein n=1 Tax=Epicoccum nigrum TaxID=105696 RepID=A0A1Y2LM22_EPING|nr:hypothetical protein B5807_11348 [Epicoccum nigrum]
MESPHPLGQCQDRPRRKKGPHALGIVHKASLGLMMEGNEFHPIACESCRKKKSKCSREIPICSQCAALRVACQYPQMNKRGIPSGYVSLIEQRLVETELLVLELLSALQETGGSIENQHRLSENQRRLLEHIAQKQSKTDKIEEWKCFPLGTDQQRQAWRTAKQACFFETQMSPPQEQLAMEMSPTPKFSPNNSESMQNAQPASSPARSAVQRSSFTIASPVRLQEETANYSLRATQIGPPMDLRSQDADIVVVNTPLPSVTPSGSDAGNVDKWRKYF